MVGGGGGLSGTGSGSLQLLTQALGSTGLLDPAVAAAAQRGEAGKRGSGGATGLQRGLSSSSMAGRERQYSVVFPPSQSNSQMFQVNGGGLYRDQ